MPLAFCEALGRPARPRAPTALTGCESRPPFPPALPPQNTAGKTPYSWRQWTYGWGLRWVSIYW